MVSANLILKSSNLQFSNLSVKFSPFKIYLNLLFNLLLPTQTWNGGYNAKNICVSVRPHIRDKVSCIFLLIVCKILSQFGSWGFLFDFLPCGEGWGFFKSNHWQGNNSMLKLNVFQTILNASTLSSITQCRYKHTATHLYYSLHQSRQQSIILFVLVHKCSSYFYIINTFNTIGNAACNN